MIWNLLVLCSGLLLLKINAQGIEVESFRLPLWVIRKDFQILRYNESFENSRDPFYNQFASLFEKAIGDAYNNTPLREGYVRAQVQGISEPYRHNGTWDTGIYCNCIIYFVGGFVPHPDITWNLLLSEIVANNYEIATSGLYINPFQISPYSPCFGSDCHTVAYCIPRGHDNDNYTCQCPNEYSDLDPNFPGRKCRPKWKYSECYKAEDNQCDVNAICIELDLLYRCECMSGYVDQSLKDAIPGSKCVYDYCYDAHFCPANMTCKNLGEQTTCECARRFMDIRKSEKRWRLGLGDVNCVPIQKVDECALGLTSCSGVAICTDLIIGYECACPLGYVDGNPAHRGRICNAKSSNDSINNEVILLNQPINDLCNGQGDASLWKFVFFILQILLMMI